jgi:hypothetical protein
MMRESNAVAALPALPACVSLLLLLPLLPLLLLLLLQRALQVEQRMRMLPGLIEKLQQGVKVADVGCGCV